MVHVRRMRLQTKSIAVTLSRIDGKGYKAYRKLLNAKEVIDGIRIEVVRVQGDPYAPPSVVKVVSKIRAPKWALDEPVPLADWLTRRLYKVLQRFSKKIGEGRSGYLGIPRPGPIMIRRSSLEVIKDTIVARVYVGLPSKHRRVLGDYAEELLLEKIPKAFKEVLNINHMLDSLREHIYTWKMQEYIRMKLPHIGLVSFIGDGSILPRKCGGCEEPLPNAIPFESPPSLRTTITLPWGDEVTGMGIRKGITVIAGSAFHGKSTLLEAIAAGIWNHVPGDGRERVVTIREAMYVRAEDGRYVSCVDISSMVHNIPEQSNTSCFTTRDASGATSIAASIQEAIEIGAKLILLDEDTAATNILYIDERAKNITKWHTITPLSSLAKSMKKKGISLIIVSSGSLPLLAVADTIIVMEAYKPIDRTIEAKELVKQYNVEIHEKEYIFPSRRKMIEVKPLKKPKIKGRSLEDKSLPAPIPLYNNIHLVEETQLHTLLTIVKRIQNYKNFSIDHIVRSLENQILKSLSNLDHHNPKLGEVRALDIAYLLNRLPVIKFSNT